MYIKKTALVLSSWSRMEVWKVYGATFFFLTTGPTKKELLPFWKGLQGLSTKGEIREKKANWSCYLLVSHKRCQKVKRIEL